MGVVVIFVLWGARHAERRLQLSHIVQGTSKTPHVYFEVEWLAFENFRAGIEWSADLAYLETATTDTLRNPHVCYLNYTKV